MRGASKRPVQILLVEDNPGDVRLTEEVLREAKVATKLSTVRDGEEAMAFVRREGAHAGAPRPDLILLDLNLPRKDGREVLNELKSDDELRRIPVIVLTTSMAEPDILMSYDLHANCYIHKPIEFEEFSTAINSIQQFWLLTVQLPPS
jgi:two-component system, chemotaxis family, response regulator Rcp1